MVYKFFISDNKNPYFNLAMERYLFRFCDTDCAILYLWQNSDTIVVGKNQDVYSECRVDEFKRNGGFIARRRSGGGAVFHDSGNLNFSIICNSNNAETVDYKDIIIGSLRLLGITAEYNGRNDIMIGNRKVSGNAAYNHGDVLCQHGTILINSDIEKMTYYLTPDTEKLERNFVKSVFSRVMNLSEHCSGISVNSVCQAMIDYTDAIELKIDNYSNEITSLTEFYSGFEWIYGGKV